MSIYAIVYFLTKILNHDSTMCTSIITIRVSIINIENIFNVTLSNLKVSCPSIATCLNVLS